MGLNVSICAKDDGMDMWNNSVLELTALKHLVLRTADVLSDQNVSFSMSLLLPLADQLETLALSTGCLADSS